MSWQAMDSVLTNSKSEGNERLLMIVLAHHADAVSFSCYPAIDTIVSESKLSRATVFRLFEKLKARGELTVESGKGASGNGNRKSNRYIINVQRSHHSETFEHSQRSHQTSQNSGSNVSNSASKGLTALRPEYKEYKTEHNDRMENGRCRDVLEKEKKSNLNGTQSKGSESEIEGQTELNGQNSTLNNNSPFTREEALACAVDNNAKNPEGMARWLLKSEFGNKKLQAWRDEKNAEQEKSENEKRYKEKKEACDKIASRLFRQFLDIEQDRLPKIRSMLENITLQKISTTFEGIDLSELDAKLMQDAIKTEVDYYLGSISDLEPLTRTSAQAILESFANHKGLSDASDRNGAKFVN